MPLCKQKLQRGSDIFFSSAKWYLSSVCWEVVHSSHLFQCFPLVRLDSHFFLPCFFSPPLLDTPEKSLVLPYRDSTTKVLLPVNFGNNGLRRLYGECVGNTCCPKLFAYPILLPLHIFLSKQRWCSEGHCQEIVWIPMRRADIFIEILESRFPHSLFSCDYRWQSSFFSPWNTSLRKQKRMQVLLQDTLSFSCNEQYAKKKK